MNARFLKLLIFGAFFSFATGVYLTSGDSISAQKKQSDILEKAATYKTWKQAVKTVPERRLEGSLNQAPVPITIEDSSSYG